MPRVNVEIPDEIHMRAKLAAVTARITLQQLVIRGLELATEEAEREQKK